MICIKHRGNGNVLVRVNGRSLAGVDLSGASLRGAGLSGADLSGADLRAADFTRATVGTPGRTLGIDLARIALAWFLLGFLLHFVFIDLRWAIRYYESPLFSWLYPLLHPIAWSFLVTFWCVIRACQALDRWRRAIWAPVNLQRANLQGADLTGAALAGSKWEGAIYDEHTRWPAGFDPEKVGAVPRE